MGMVGSKMWATDLSYMYFVVVDAHNLQKKLRMTLLSMFVEDHVLFKVLGLLRLQEFICSHLLKFFHTTRLRPPSSNIEAGESSETTCEPFKKLQ